MEQLKDGLEDWRTTITCEKFDQYDVDGCGAEYSISEGDLVLRFFRGTHFKHYYTAMQCMECTKYTRVYNVPQLVLSHMYTAENLEAAMFDGFQD